MDYVGAAILAVVIGLSIVAALLLRNEDAVAKAWRKRRRDKEPLGPRLAVAYWSLLTIANVALAIDAGDTIRLVLAALYVVLFARLVRSFRRSRSRDLKTAN